jgi:hypothetical protein
LTIKELRAELKENNELENNINKYFNQQMKNDIAKEQKKVKLMESR